MKRWMVVFLFLGLLWFPSVSHGAEREGEMEMVEDFEERLSLEEVDEAVEGTFSLEDYVSDVMDGKVSFSLGDFWNRLVRQMQGRLEEQKSSFIKILMLGVLAGIFMNFAGTVGDRDLSDAGFFVTFLLLLTVLTAGFSQIYSITESAMDDLLLYMQALVPSFSLSLCLGAGTGTSLFFYETMLMGISLLEMLMLHVFLPGVQVYFMLCMVNQLAENRFSRLAELVRSLLRWSMKLIFGLLIGYQGIQGMLLPVMDKVKNSAVLQTAKGLPGVGNTLGSVADTIYGSGMLIKSAVGIGGILAIGALCLYPLLKLLAYTALYRLGGALVQPLSDRRVTAAVMAAAESGKLMLGMIFAGALMFVLSITIVLVSTNAVQ